MGGDPRRLTLRGFLDAAYALLIEEYGRMGVGLTDALEQTAMWRAGADGNEPQSEPREPPQEKVAADNAAALLQLKAQMAGVQGGPRV